MVCEVLLGNIAGIFAVVRCVVLGPGDQILTFIYAIVVRVRSEVEWTLLGLIGRYPCKSGGLALHALAVMTVGLD